MPNAITNELFVTLRRGLAGKRKLLVKTLLSIGLRKPRSVIQVPNTSSLRGKLEQVKHLIKVETGDGYRRRLEKRAERFRSRPSIVSEH